MEMKKIEKIGKPQTIQNKRLSKLEKKYDPYLSGFNAVLS